MSSGTFISMRGGLAEVYNRDKGICHLCGLFVPMELASLDHLIPRSAWKELNDKERSELNTNGSNALLAHQLCNSRRGNKPIEDIEIKKPHSIPRPKARNWWCLNCDKLNKLSIIEPEDINQTNKRILVTCKYCRADTVYFINKALGIECGPLIFQPANEA